MNAVRKFLVGPILVKLHPKLFDQRRGLRGILHRARRHSETRDGDALRRRHQRPQQVLKRNAYHRRPAHLSWIRAGAAIDAAERRERGVQGGVEQRRYKCRSELDGYLRIERLRFLRPGRDHKRSHYDLHSACDRAYRKFGAGHCHFDCGPDQIRERQDHD